MTEETISFYFHAKRPMSESELLKLATISFQADDETQVTRFYMHSFSEELHVLGFANKFHNLLNIRFYKIQLMYVFDIHALKSNGISDINSTYIRRIEEQLRTFLGTIDNLKQLRCLMCPIRRGQPLWRYFVTSDERLVELNFSQLVVEKQTKYQNVKILWSELHGNTLFLDDDVNLSENSHESYTRVLLGLETGKPPRNNFADKEILILGGGDGGVMCELLKQGPRMVTMCEIDIEVVQLSAEHMRGACEDALDTLEGPNKQILIGDCLAYLHKCIQSGKKFDYIINDLTEFMVNKEERGWDYDFVTDNSQIMEISLKALKPDGCYLSRGGALSHIAYWKKFESDCQKLGLRYNAYTNFVPSFNEVYLFYEVRFVAPSSGDSQ